MRRRTARIAPASMVTEFREEVIKIYNNEMSGKIGDLIAFFQKKAGDIEEIVRYDNEKWNEEGYGEEIEKMIGWMGERYEFFEKEYSERIEVENIVSD